MALSKWFTINPNWMWLIVAALIFVGFPNISTAAPITFNFSGSNGGINDPGNLVGGIATNLSFSGSFTYDTSAGQRGGFFNGTSTIENYVVPAPTAPSQFSVTMNGVTFSSDPARDLEMTVTDGIPGAAADKFDLFYRPAALQGITAPDVSSTLSIFFTASSGNEFTSASLPTNLAIPGSFFGTFLMHYRDPNNGGNLLFTVGGLFDSVVVQPATVPIPAGFVLLLSALGFFGLRRLGVKR